MNQRLGQLDSLRGLAAATVVISHFMLTIPAFYNGVMHGGSPPWVALLTTTPLHLLRAGHEAVIFFFVLSGFVLSLPFLKEGRPVLYRTFVVKRILRIYSPYLLAVCAAFLLRQYLYHGDVATLSEWFNQSWREPVSGRVVREHFLLVGCFSNCAFDPVLWSLVQEMRISLIFPLLIYCIRSWEKVVIAVALSFSVFVHFMIRQKFLGTVSYEHDYFDTLHFIGMFVIGGVLAKHRVALVNWTGGLRKGTKLGLLAVSILAYTNAAWLPVYGTFHVHFLALLFSKWVFTDWATTVGVAGIITLALGTQSLANFLSWRSIRFLGWISYSLYLFHAICLKVVGILLHAVLPLWGVLLAALILSLLVATVSAYFIEEPSIRLGRRLTERWSPSREPYAYREAENVAP